MMRNGLSHPTRRLRVGFTLIEMVLVMSLIGILALMSAGRVEAYIQQRNVVSASEIVRNDLQQAFAIAARNRRPVRIAFASADTALRLTDRANTVTFISRGLGRGSGLMIDPSEVAFCTSTCSSATVDVYPNGWATDTLRVTISKGSYSRVIRMSRSGLVTTR